MNTKILEHIDFEKVNTLLEGFNQTTGFVTAILDLEGNVLSKSGWRQICTEFHRINPETAKKCAISDTVLANEMSKGEKYHFYKCLNGLVDVAVPIIIKGEHVANLFSGQFFFEKPDVSFFKKQAKINDFEESSYIKALEEVPVISQKKVKIAMEFLLNMTEMISEITFQKLEQIELNEERKNAEEALRLREEMMRNSQSVAHICSYSTDMNVNEINTSSWVCSPEFYKIFGIDETYPHTIDGWANFIHPDYRKKVFDYHESVVKEKKTFSREYKIIRINDGAERWVHGTGKLEFDEKGNPVRMHGAIQDITERKNTEEHLRQAQKMEAVGSLAGGVAHDFNNMLSIILGNAEIIMEDIDPSNPLILNLEEIYKAAERSANLTRQLLAFARKQTIDPKILNLNQALDDMLKMLKRLIGEDIDLTWEPAQNLWFVKIDPSQIDQILANLCVNARDAIKSVGKVTIETDNFSFDEAYCTEHAGFNPGDYVMMAVSDNGSGMDKKVLNNLFEPFFTTKGIGHGTGLGLATVYGIVKQNDGFINVYSEPGEGTTFKIYLPVYSEMAVPKQKTFKKTSLTGNETILLVEDEKAILRMTKMMLERLDYTVLTASTPKEAISIVKASNINTIHLLLTDVVMPEMNGRDLSKKLLSIYPDLKCLFMSGYTANVIAHHGVLDTGVQFINKPFSTQDLSTKVREVLDKAKGPAHD